MDIARTPSNPDGNIEMADAAMQPHDPPEIRREDYRPFPWLVPDTRLDFELGLDSTRVRSRLTVMRNAKADKSPTIRLNGDGITATSVKVDGEPTSAFTMDGDDLVLTLPGDAHEIAIETEIDPASNSQLMGLYASNGMLCTQCESEGFRRITFFPDRPDVLSTYTVRMSGPKARFPILLCNGNRVATGEEGDDHWAEWHDPWPKPSYLFALVAGDLVANTDSFTTMNGREVELNVWVREGDLERTQHAMDSLKRSMKWDEEAFGREYDLDLFNIVAVSDFNMGAMENKGLNVFNTKYVLADPDTATDGDFDAGEGGIGHEYFHNWSGASPAATGSSSHSRRASRSCATSCSVRTWALPRSSGSRTCASCVAPSSPRTAARWRIPSGPTATARSAISIPRRSTTRAPRSSA